jgi:hypothetical protein
VALFAPPKPEGMEDGPAGPEGAEERDVLGEVAIIQDLLRKAVRRCIEDDQFRSIFDEDAKIQERWPV